MTETAAEPAAPEPSPEPTPDAPEGGPLTHVEAWVAKHLGPDLAGLREDIADIRIKAERADTGLRKVVPLMSRLSAVVQELAQAAPAGVPAASSLLDEAGAIVAEAAKIGAELAVVL